MTKKEIEKYYDDIYKAAKAAALSDTNARISEYNTQKEQALSSLDRAGNQLYADYIKAKTELPAALARQGITGGSSESANIRLTSDYMNKSGENKLKKSELLASLEAKIAEVKESGRNALSRLRSQSALDKYNAIAKLDKEAYQTALSEAKLKAGYGDFSGYKALGIDTQAMEREYNAPKESKKTIAAAAGKDDSTDKAEEPGDSILRKYYSYLFKYGPEMALAAAADSRLEKYLEKWGSKGQ